MKKIILGLGFLSLALIIGLFTNAGIVRAIEETPQEECVDTPTPDPIRFPKGNLIKVTHQWFEEDGYWVLKADIDPRGGHEIWVKTGETIEIVVCPEAPEEPEVPEEEQPATPSAAVSHSENRSSGFSMPTAPQCTSEKPSLGIANINVVRTSDTTALVQWSLHSGDNTHVMFGETGTGWHHAALNVGVSGEAVINELVKGRTYDWVVIPMNGCAAGSNSPVLSNI